MTNKNTKKTKEVREDLPQKWDKSWEDLVKKYPPKTKKVKK